MSRPGCKSIRPLISAYMDGELMPDETRRLLEHLAICEDCTTLLQEYQLLREQVRHLPPPPTPPADIQRRVWEETIERGEPSRFQRWFGISGARIGLSAVGAVAVFLIATAFVLMHGYERVLPPAVTGAPPTTVQEWPVQRPIEITFNKPMDPESVVEHLRIYPPSEKERLPISWRGNTMIIGASPSETVPLLANTDYRIIILPGAKDAYGGSLRTPWELRLRTTTVLAQEPTPTPPPTEARPTSPTQPAAVVTQAPTATNPPPTVPPTQPEPTATSGQPTAPVGAGPTVTPTQPQPNQTATQPAPSPTPTTPPTVAPTSTPVPTQPPAASPPPDGSPSPGTPPAATPVPVTGAFGSVYWAYEDVRDRLGAPTPPGAYSAAAGVLDFQRGTMYARFDTRTIYVLQSNGVWFSAPDTWTADDPVYGGPAPEPNLWIPTKSFGKLWAENPTIQEQLGYATTETAHEPMDGRIQEFANGLMLYSDTGYVYVLYFDPATPYQGQWEVYPDSSGRGDLLTPTPEPSPSDDPASPEPTAEPTDPASPEPTTTPDASPAPTESAAPGTPAATPDATPDGTPGP